MSDPEIASISIMMQIEGPLADGEKPSCRETPSARRELFMPSRHRKVQRAHLTGRQSDSDREVYGLVSVCEWTSQIVNELLTR